MPRPPRPHTTARRARRCQARSIGHVGLLLALLYSAPALATPPAWLDPFGRLEVGPAFPLSAPQSDYFRPGVALRINGGVGFTEWFALQLSFELGWFPARSAAPVADAGVPLGVGGGVRFKLPYRYPVSPWLDADLLYVRTGRLDRLGYTLGIGLHVPVGAARIVRIGPFLRYFQITDSDSPNVDSADAKMLIAGASLELGVSPQRADKDKDGVPDYRDRCPTIAGLASHGGCPDRDGDGVADPDDACVDTAGPAATRGCPDKDKDGVADTADKCPDQAGPASLDGCPDQDNDGISDASDQCPTVPGPASTAGCPDRDGDGLKDQDDQCPDQAGVSTAGGCPDRDHDGVGEPADRCPDEPGPAASYGCPDRDGDGVSDSKDACPDEAGHPSAAGCPDRDGDGVVDTSDRCPDFAGPAATAGCPPPTAVVTEGKIAISEKVYFGSGKAVIEKRSHAILDEVVKLLVAHPELAVRVEGHTDNVQVKHVDNLALSKKRALAVRAYLLQKKIPAARVAAEGFGSLRPRLSNTTAVGRDANRRVDFVIVPR